MTSKAAGLGTAAPTTGAPASGALAAGAAGTGPGTGRGDTRERIQQVAVELFTEHGYDKTSLREIAERLDVTKAALYYHFKSKEDIVVSLVEDYYGELDGLIAWGRTQPRSAATRREVLRRYVSIVADGEAAFRMLHQNQAAVSSLASAKGSSSVFRERLTALADLLAGPDAPVTERVRALMALGGVSIAWMFCADQALDRAELSAAVLEAGYELAAPGDGEPAPGS
jgi:AcrR family transcriptional regulator